MDVLGLLKIDGLHKQLYVQSATDQLIDETDLNLVELTGFQLLLKNKINHAIFSEIPRKSTVSGTTLTLNKPLVGFQPYNLIGNYVLLIKTDYSTEIVKIMATNDTFDVLTLENAPTGDANPLAIFTELNRVPVEQLSNLSVKPIVYSTNKFGIRNYYEL